MEPDGKLNVVVVNELDGAVKQIKIEVTTNSSDDEQSELEPICDNGIENCKNMVNNTITKEEFMKNSDLKLILSENIVTSKSKMEGSISSKSNSMVNGQSSGSNTLSTPKTMEKKPGARLNTDLSPVSNPRKIAKMSPRATRSSQNPDFAAKQRKFLNRVHDPIRRDYSDSENSQENSSPISAKTTKEKKSPSGERKPNSDSKKKSDKDGTPKRTATEAEEDEEGPTKKKRTKEPTKVVGGVDSYCWRCHRDGTVIPCGGCPRVYHLKCVQMEEAPPKGWVCPECITLMQAENTDTRSRAMRMLSLDQLCNLLRYALTRMKTHEGASDFARAVDVVEFPNYRDYIVKPMDLALLERNIKSKTYGSTEAFLADAKWIVHNSIIFNSGQSQFTNAARGILKICRQEMQEIENCPDCYQNAHTRSSDSWFIEACRRPHLLVWAKLKGFPFWPAKAMTTNSEGLVDVRFFGAHDRAWVPVNCCYLFSKQSPVPASNKNRRNLEDCLEELEIHIKKLKDKFGQFEYPPFKTPYDPKNEEAQLEMFLPKYDPKGAGKRSRMSLLNDGARKSFMGSKFSPTTSRKRLPEDVSAPKTKTNEDDNVLSKVTTVKPCTSEVTKPCTSEVTKPCTSEVTKPYSPEMVSFPSEVNGISDPSPTFEPHFQPDQGTPKSREVQSILKKKTLLEQTPPSKQDTTVEMKKTSHRTPLTAAAKKCFAMEEKTCFRCKTVSESTLNWSTDSESNSVCSTCAETRGEPLKEVETRKDQLCSKCQITIEDAPLQQSETLLCVECSRLKSPETSPVQSEFKKAEVADNGRGTMKGTIIVPMNVPEAVESQEESVDPLPALSVDVLSEAPGEDSMHHTPTENTMMDFAPIDSPPKFVIPKTTLDTSKTSKKANSIVDYLHEKICFAVEEAIKHSVPVDEEPVPSTSTAEESDQPATSATSQIEPEVSDVVEPIVPVRDSVSPPIDLMSDVAQEPTEEIRDSVTPPLASVRDSDSPCIMPVRDAVSPVDLISETAEEPTVTISDPESPPESIVPDRDLESQTTVSIREQEPVAQVVLEDLKNDKLMIEKLKELEVNKSPDLNKKPEVEIHTLSDTSSDVDDNSIECDMVTEEENNKKKKHIDSVVRTLTERKSSVDERSEQHKSPVTKEINTVILDDSNEDIPVLIIDEGEGSSPDSKSSDKGDKSRRKGIPAKVLSRSSSSSESSPPDESPKTRLNQEVLDEVSGKFRRSSEDSNVTITVVTDVSPPPKKTNEIRTVNISKSLSLSVVNESSAGLEMECIGSDLEEQVVIDPIVKKLKPTARKTLPKPPPIDLPTSPSTSKTNEPDVVALTSNQRVIFPPRQAPRVYGPGKTQHSGPPGLMSISNSVTPARTEESSPSEQLKEACKKLTGTLTNVVMEVLRGLSEGGNLEATVKLLQLELEQQRQRHKHEVNEVLHNADMSIREHKALLEADKQRELLDTKHKFEMEKERVVQETKRKTWCTFCPKEATLYCCWNTAYCTYTCQQAHWTMHMETCSNKQQPDQPLRPTPPTQPSFSMPPAQRMRQMMPPPVNPPPYSQPYRPNQMYAMGPRFAQGPSHPRTPIYNSQLDGLYPRGTP